MIPVEKKSMIEIDRKNMLNRYSKIVVEKLVGQTDELKAAQEQPKQADPEDRRCKTESSPA